MIKPAREWTCGIGRMVMAGSKVALFMLQKMTPHSYNAMTYLVMAMASAHNNAGKKTFFGKDKGVKAYQDFQIKLKNMITAMVLDGQISESMPSNEVVEKTVTLLEQFAEAHPNWIDAYKFASAFFVLENDEAISVINRLR